MIINNFYVLQKKGQLKKNNKSKSCNYKAVKNTQNARTFILLNY